MFTRVEAVALSIVALAAAAIVAAYLAGTLGLTLHPAVILFVAAAASAVALLVLWRRTATAHEDAVAFAAIVASVLTWLLWLAWPHLLPIGSGPDLTHHLLLIDFIERTGHLVRDATLAGRLGEMVDYTPGSHLLVVLAGRWIGSDGLHAAHAIVAGSVALKAGLVFLIALRCLPADRVRTPFAIAAALLLVVPRAYFEGSFAQNWFLAQVVSELFAVAMWWAIVAWDQQPSHLAAAIFACAGSGAFLSWPVWVGPPIAAHGLGAG